MQGKFVILVVCAILRCATSITLSLENNDNLEEAIVVPTDDFGRCRETDSIDLSFYNINHIRDDLLKGSNIASIYLNSNNIREIPNYTFKDVRTLLCLDFSRNRIPVHKLMDFGHETVQALDLGYQRTDDNNEEWSDRLVEEKPKTLVTTMFSHFPSLRYLDISGNLIYDMPDNFSAVVPQLTHIYLRNRNFKDLSDNFFHQMPKSLKSLHIENNKMKIINFTENLPIEALFLDENPLSPAGYLFSPFVKILSLSKCTLETLHLYENEVSWSTNSNSLLGNVPNLLSLDLSWNKLQHIEDFEALSRFNFLKRLSLSHNQFKEFPVHATFTALEGLSISFNQITMIPNIISGFPSLKILNLRGNQIQTIHGGAFENMVLLQDLDLSHNNLESLPSMLLEPLANLHRLDVRHNKFVKIANMFGQRPLSYNLHLTDLYVKSDALKTVDLQELEDLPASCVVHTC